MDNKTSEQLHWELMQALEHELDTYGPASLAEVIASLIDPRTEDDPDNPHREKAEWWRQVRKEFENLAWRLSRQ